MVAQPAGTVDVVALARVSPVPRDEACVPFAPPGTNDPECPPEHEAVTMPSNAAETASFLIGV